ncbi:MAG: hypothetical protein HFI37_05645 [Lachnospiraceae bacterium]|nr:hypothetical protein [Lachnospiraceae bacterium]
MRRRISDLANGKFEYEKPQIVFSKDRIEIQVLEGQNYRGSFTIQSENEIPMRGMLYTSDTRMECLNPQFEGLEVQIQFEFHSEGLTEGNVQKGEFYIICNQNEYNLSFVVTISRLYAKSSVGKVKTLYDFAKLAAENRKEAYEIFTSPMFANLLKKEDKKIWMLYEGLSKSPVTLQNLEEFLIGSKQKAKILLTLEQSEIELLNVRETTRESIFLMKNQWGYLEMEIFSEAEFLKPVREKMTTEDFIGSVLELEYLIDVEKLHAGRNFGRLQIASPYQTLTCTICVYQQSEMREREQALDETRKIKAAFMKSYLDFRLRKQTLGAWAEEALRFLEPLIAAFPEEHWYGLMRAQVFFLNGQRQEADWILEEKKKDITDKNSPAWAYYLYLTTLMIREEKYVDKVLKQIEEICYHYPKDLRLLWILLFLRKDYAKNTFGKYRALREWMVDGCTSPYFYIETYLLLEREPYILAELGEFERRILLWAMRKEVLTKEIALRVMELAGDRRIFEKQIYDILCGCYTVCPSEEMLTVICAYLIKGQKYDVGYHHWYEDGIARDLRLAGLYEAFVYSMDRREVRQVPKMLQMYFRYHSSLPYTKKAALYVNIIANREEQPSVYASYERIMENFALEQIVDGHLDDNLAVIYDTFLREAMIQKETAEALSELLFYHKLTCFDPNAVRLYVVHWQLKEGLTVPLCNGTAYFPIYSSEYMIFLEDRLGNRYASSMEYQLERLMRPGRFIRRCMEQAPDCLSFFIYLLDQRPSMETVTREDTLLLQKFLSSEKISEEYRSDLCPKVIRLFHKYEIPIEDADALLKMDPSYLNQSARKYMIELFVDRQNYELAYQWIQMYGCELIEPASLAAVVSHMVQDEKYEEDELLTYLGIVAFLQGEYNETILNYLCSNYDGPTKMLGKLWDAAKKAGVATYELEERVLTQMLYSTDYDIHTGDIFESYCKKGGQDLIKRAYINYFAYAYFVENVVLTSQFMQYLIAKEEAGQNQTEICRLATLKYLAFSPKEQKEHLALIERSLARLVAENKYFAFYKNFSIEIQQKFGFEDRIFIEYHNQPRKRVWLYYRAEQDEEYEKREMRENYQGIYVSAFCLFFGESVQYYISQEESVENVILESNRISGDNIYAGEKRSRFALLNRMLAEIERKEMDESRDGMLEYEKMETVFQETFRIL